jgi:CDP-glycerol:poly(glycerophosphate) glycerophosphotransferase
MSGDRVWVVLAEELATRVFVQCGILAKLHERLGERLLVVDLLGAESSARWAPSIEAPVVPRSELLPWKPPAPEKARRKADSWLDRQIGFFPLAIRFNERHGFHAERMMPGHPNRILDTSLGGPLPHTAAVERGMTRWFFSARRYVPSALERRLREDCGLLVLANVQVRACVPFLAAARRLHLPAIGYVASWDHTVGKGVLTPYLDRYVVQNRAMRDDLERYHGIAPERVVVTGWPQTDVFHRRRTRDEYEALLRDFGLDPARPLVLVAGNTPTNAPYEARFVKRVMSWWRATAADRVSLLFRPHPRDVAWEERFAAARAVPHVHVQQASFTDMEILATLLQHADCVVTNAGTILLDALVNDRPSVCVVYDEGAPPGESWAEKNVLGQHYRELMPSGSFLLASSFDEVAAAIERSLADPDELAEERRRVAIDVAGEVDGHAADRVVHAIVEVAGA